MDAGRFVFDSSPSHGHMLLLGGGDRNPIFRSGRSIFGIVEESGGAGGARNKRPFFTSPDEVFDEEYYDEQMPEKKRRLTPEQVHLLERSFDAENKLEPERKSELARKLGLQPRQIAVWFQNRRARWKTKQLENDFDQLKSSYDALVADHDALLQDNDRLRSQVLALTEKLQQRELDAAHGLKQDEVGSSADLTALVAQQKAEDMLSSGSDGSAVVDGEGPQHLFTDNSGESYFPQVAYNGVQEEPADVGGVLLEEDDVSDEGCSYYPDGVFPAEHQLEDEEVDGQLGLWVWS